MPHRKTIHWFRQDLRLQDNPALFEAAKQGDVLPVYILDDHNSGKHKMGAASRLWLYHALKSLNESLDGNLSVFKGNPADILGQLIQQHGIQAVHWNRCYEPWRIKRDKQLKQVLVDQGIDVNSYNGSLLWEPWEALKKDQTHYKVFTPFYRKKCLTLPDPRVPLPAPENISFIQTSAKTNLDQLDLRPEKDWGKGLLQHWEISEAGAQDKLKTFLDDKAYDYKEGRNFPAKQLTSLLSPYLHFGQISPNQVWHATYLSEEDQNIDCFRSELGWREFAHNLLYYNPTLPTENLQKKFDAFVWEDNPEALSRWQKGQTGVPIVDAGMRELWQTGTMHNRVRMIVGSYLVKNLLLDWRLGEQWFWDCLFDADLANNSAGWQWIAGCGADAAPYFRIFNPITQGQKFDPDGEYTRKYVPELKELPNKYLFNPWEAPELILKGANIKLGVDYPSPIVDLKFSRERALSAFKHLKDDTEGMI